MNYCDECEQETDKHYVTCYHHELEGIEFEDINDYREQVINEPR